MRILHLLASPVFSGPAEAVALLASAQRRAGEDVSVAVDATRPGTGTEEAARPRFEALGLLDHRGLALSAQTGPRQFLAEVLGLRRLRVDVLHVHTSHGHWVGWLGRPAGARLIRSVHAPRSLRWSMPPFDAATVPEEGLLSQLPPAPAMVLPALVDSQLFRPNTNRRSLRQALGLAEGPVVGMASTFQPSRGHELGIAAFAELRRRMPGATLVLLGDGILEGQVRRWVAEAGLENCVRLPGYQPGPEFVRWLQALDELWVLGLGNDWAGRTALQARACDVRVVAVPLGALPRWADRVLAERTPAALAAVALAAQRRKVTLPHPDAVAADVLTLYRRAGARP
jgi:L-malate glycosyltransferase